MIKNSNKKGRWNKEVESVAKIDDKSVGTSEEHNQTLSREWKLIKIDPEYKP